MSEQSARPGFVAASMAALGTVGLLVGFVLGIVTFGVVGTPLSIGIDSLPGQLVFTVGTYAGIAAVGAVYLLRYELSLSYVRLRSPSVRDGLWTAATVVVLLGLAIVVSALVTRLGLPIVEHNIGDSIRANPTVGLAFVPVSLLLVGPAEEFLYRGIVQTRLGEPFDTQSAVAIAAVIFAATHIFAYLDPTNLAGTLVTLLVIVLPLGAILGTVYEHTGNLLVPVLAHGCYNAITFGLSYVDAVGAV